MKVPLENDSSKEERLREKVISVLEIIEANSLFISSERLTIRRKRKSIQLPLLPTLTILNALTPKSAMLLIGGYGGGKTTLVTLLGRMMTGYTLSNIQNGIIRGHPHLTEEKMIATLRPGALIKEGKEEIIWREFVKSPWKIVDEVNRLSDYTQDILLSLLAEGKVKYYDSVFEVEDYTLYATLNPGGVGTFALGMPFLDRFSISAYLSPATYQDTNIIIKRGDEKLTPFDENFQVPAILNMTELMEIKREIARLSVRSDATQFINSLVRETSICARGTKTILYSSGTVEIGGRICEGCHWFTERMPCNKTTTPLSIRVLKDLDRVSKSLAWLIGEKEVSIPIVEAIIPFIIQHRVKFVQDIISAAPYYDDPSKYARKFTDLVKQRFINRIPAMRIYDDFLGNKGSTEKYNNLKDASKADLIVNMDLMSQVNRIRESKNYGKVWKEIQQAIKQRNISELIKVREKLTGDFSFPNKNQLMQEIDDALNQLTYVVLKLTLDEWKFIQSKIATRFFVLEKTLRETLRGPIRRQVRTSSLTLTVTTTGSNPEDLVYVEIAGGSDANVIKEIIQKEE